MGREQSCCRECRAWSPPRRLALRGLAMRLGVIKANLLDLLLVEGVRDGAINARHRVGWFGLRIGRPTPCANLRDCPPALGIQPKRSAGKVDRCIGQYLTQHLDANT